MMGNKPEKEFLHYCIFLSVFTGHVITASAFYYVIPQFIVKKLLHKNIL